MGINVFFKTRLAMKGMIVSATNNEPTTINTTVSAGPSYIFPHDRQKHKGQKGKNKCRCATDYRRH